MTAQQRWKESYNFAHKAIAEGRNGLAEEYMIYARRFRREAALERALEASQRESEALNEIMRAAIHIGFNYGGNDGAHHKQWTIDQMIRILAGDEYDLLVVKACAGEDGPNTYTWDTGIAP